jgi:hypothetical protein
VITTEKGKDKYFKIVERFLQINYYSIRKPLFLINIVIREQIANLNKESQQKKEQFDQ